MLRPAGIALPGEHDLPDQAQEASDMHQDRDGRLAVEIIGHAGGAISRGGAMAVPDSGKEAGKSCPEHGGKPAVGTKMQA